MDKNRKTIIVLSVTAGLLAVFLAVTSVCIIMYFRGSVGEEKTEKTAGTDTAAMSDSESTTEISDTVSDIQAPESLDSQGNDDTNDTQDEYDEYEFTVTSGKIPDDDAVLPPETDAEPGSHYKDVNEQVTAKIEVNLRSTADQGTDENIVCTLSNGDIAVRTGISENGWSRVEYNSQILYCVSSYLTTDLSYVFSGEETDAFKTKFTPVNENVTAKELTNLRDMPSVMEPSKVIFQLAHGEVAVRTGIANEGWSRVEYNGQTLYCISSYLESAEDQS